MNTSSDDSSSDEKEEIWDGILPESLARDIDSAPLLPEAELPMTKQKKVNVLVFWLVYFLLIWQVTCHISDNGMAWLLKFMVSWFKVLGLQLSSDFFAKIVTALPGSLYLMRQFLNLDRDNFNKFVVCPKCSKLYSYESCLKVVNNRQVPNLCSNYYYARGNRKTCNSTLVTKVLVKSGKPCYYPIKYYCCNSITSSLEKFVLKENFAESCEDWRKRNIDENTLADVYDGKL